MTLEEELRFAAQTLGDAQRTIICEPHRESEVSAAVELMGLTAILTVRTSEACPSGKLLVLDEQAMQASMNQMFQRAAKGIRMFRD